MSMIDLCVAIRIGHMSHPAPLRFCLMILTECPRLLLKQQTLPTHLLASLFWISRIQLVKCSFVYARLRSFLEEEIGALDPACAHLLQYSPIEPELRSALAERQITPSEISHFVACNSEKWKLFDGKQVYVARVTNDGGLTLSRERHPALSSVIQRLDGAYAFFRWQLPIELRRARVVARSVLRKRFVDRSERLFVNIGAGLWYAPTWKNLDFLGKWYSRHRLLIDYSYDLAQSSRMPFEDESVDLFYSEHVFEHLTDECCAKAFAELFRSLAPSGGIRIVVPDADLLYDKLMQKDDLFFKRIIGNRRVGLTEAFLILVAHPRKRIDERIFQDDLRSLARREFLNKYTQGLSYDYARAGEHINWFNFEKLKKMLREAGFAVVERSTEQQSRFPDARGPLFDTRPSYSLHVDALKCPE